MRLNVLLLEAAAAAAAAVVPASTVATPATVSHGHVLMYARNANSRAYVRVRVHVRASSTVDQGHCVATQGI